MKVAAFSRNREREREYKTMFSTIVKNKTRLVAIFHLFYCKEGDNAHSHTQCTCPSEFWILHAGFSLPIKAFLSDYCLGTGPRIWPSLYTNNVHYSTVYNTGMIVLLCNVQLGYAFISSFVGIFSVCFLLDKGACVEHLHFLLCQIKISVLFNLLQCTTTVSHQKRVSLCSVHQQCIWVCSVHQRCVWVCSVQQHRVWLCSVEQHCLSPCSVQQQCVSVCSIQQQRVLFCSVQQQYYFAVYSNIVTLQCTVTFLLCSVQQTNKICNVQQQFLYFAVYNNVLLCSVQYHFAVSNITLQCPVLLCSVQCYFAVFSNSMY